jgi:hypothetical protein
VTAALNRLSDQYPLDGLQVSMVTCDDRFFRLVRNAVLYHCGKRNLDGSTRRGGYARRDESQPGIGIVSAAVPWI